MLMLYPLIFLAVLWLLVTEPDRQRRRLERDPTMPWNVTVRMARESLEWYEANYRKSASKFGDEAPDA